MLTGVTITGADDAVDPRELARLSGEFPFVEWGILFSPKRAGTPRYPSPGWLMHLPRMRVAAHFCGECTRATLAGEPGWMLITVAREYARLQINGFEPPAAGLVSLARRPHSPHIILQVREERAIQDAARVAHEIGPERASLLFDPSGGRGIEPFRWPTPPFGLRMGYAGGINPSNVLDVIGDIAVANVMTFEDWWIDLESGVRDEHDRFDLRRVRELLEKVAPHISKSERKQRT